MAPFECQLVVEAVVLPGLYVHQLGGTLLVLGRIECSPYCAKSFDGEGRDVRGSPGRWVRS